jgi:hypothetical protein
MLSVRLCLVLLSVATSWSSFTDNVMTTQSSKMLRRQRVMSALIKVLSTAQNFSSGSWKGCQALAEMALANLMGKGVKDQTDLAEHGLGDLTSAQFQEAAKAAASPSAIRSVVQFLQHGMNQQRIYGILLRVYDVLFPLSQLSMNPRNHHVMMEAGLVELIVEIVSSWRPGLYSAQFSAERGSTYPVLEVASEILQHLTRYLPARKRMIELNLESTCERLIREHVKIVQHHAVKVLWRLRDRDDLLHTLDSIIDGVEHMKMMAVRYHWTEPERNLRIKGLIHEEGVASSLHHALQWLNTNIDSDALLHIRNMMMGMDRKSLGLVMHELRRLVQRNKMLRFMVATRWRRKHASCKAAFFVAWHDNIQQFKIYRQKGTKVIRRWIRKGLAVAFEAWQLNIKNQRDHMRVARKIILRWTHMSLGSAFDQWCAIIDQKHAVMSRVLGTWRNRPLSAGFSLWLEHVKVLKQQQSVIIRVLKHWTNRTIAKVFDTWCQHSREQRKINFVGIKILKHWTHRTAAAAFESWNAHALEQKKMKAVCTKVLRHMLHRKLSMAFDTWREHSSTKMRIEMVCSRVIARMLNGKLATAFGTWCDHANQQRHMEDVCSRVLKHWTQRSAAAAFESWNAHALEQKKMKAVCTKVLRHMLHRKLSMAFDTWREHSSTKKRIEMVCSRVIARMLNGKLATAFGTWCDHANQQRHMEDVCSRVLKHWTQRSAAAAFESWNAHALEQKKMKAVCTKVLRHMLHRKLSMAFDTWREHSSTKKRIEMVCSRVIARMLNGKLAGAFSAWLTHLARVKETYEKAGMVMKMWRQAGRGLGRCSDCGAEKDLRIHAFERWTSFTDHMASTRLVVLNRMSSRSEQILDSVMQCFANLKMQAEQRRKTSSLAAHLVFSSMNRANRMKSFGAWKEFVVKPMMWLNDEHDFDSNVKDLKISFTRIPSQFLSQRQFGEAVVKDIANVLKFEPGGLDLIRCDENSVSVRVHSAFANETQSVEQLVMEIRRQIQDRSSPMHVLTTGAVLANVEEIRKFRQSEGDSSDAEESEPIVKHDNRGAQRCAPPRPKTALFTDPSAAARDNSTLLDRAGSTLTDGSNDADELIELAESGAVLKRASRNSQRSAPPPTSTSPLQFEQENMSRPEVVFEGVNAHTVFAESKMEMALRIHALRQKCESLERVCRQYKRCKGPIRYMMTRTHARTHARTAPGMSRQFSVTWHKHM